MVVSARDLQPISIEVKELLRRYGHLKPDEAFVVWFLRGFLTDDEDQAIKALAGASADKGIDAVYIDGDTRSVSIVQGKYRYGAGAPTEKRSDLMAFAGLGSALGGDRKEFGVLEGKMGATTLGRIERARSMLRAPGSKLNLYFVTTGRVSGSLRAEAEHQAARAKATLQVFDRSRLVQLLQMYVEGAAPPVPTLEFPVQGKEVFSRFDSRTGISSYLFSMLGRDLGSLYERVGVRVFARNIRGYLGRTKVNRQMRETVKNEPEFFWYFNNGVTVVADSAQVIEGRGQWSIRADNSQIINGQQTTRTLAETSGNGVSVLVKLISIPFKAGQPRVEYRRIISEIVEATNWQNQISLSDLRSNDEIQVTLERELRKMGYQYLRKRMSKSEARQLGGRQFRWVVRKEEIARAVGGSLFDPYLLRLGKERLFEEEYYRRIFHGRTAAELLSFFWLFRAVASHGRGDSRRGYARWVVLNRLWQEGRRTLGSDSAWHKFRKISENERKFRHEHRPLDSAIKLLYRGAAAFYRANRMSLARKRRDESTFFKQSGLERKFGEFWRSQPNTAVRRKTRDLLGEFATGLRTVELRAD